MKYGKIALLLLITVLLFSLVAGCGAQSKLVGTWEAETEASILGVGIEIPFLSESVISFTFEKDGTGAMSTEMGAAAPTVSRAYTYTVEEDQLTLTYESGSVEEYTFTVEKDVLKLDGRVDLELNKIS